MHWNRLIQIYKRGDRTLIVVREAKEALVKLARTPAKQASKKGLVIRASTRSKRVARGGEGRYIGCLDFAYFRCAPVVPLRWQEHQFLKVWGFAGIPAPLFLKSKFKLKCLHEMYIIKRLLLLLLLQLVNERLTLNAMGVRRAQSIGPPGQFWHLAAKNALARRRAAAANAIQDARNNNKTGSKLEQ
eukprot:1553853-Pleurochrysis_carterae.AAC.1